MESQSLRSPGDQSPSPPGNAFPATYRRVDLTTSPTRFDAAGVVEIPDEPMDLSEQAPDASGLGSRRPATPVPANGEEMRSDIPSMYASAPFPAQSDSESSSNGRMMIDLESSERLSEISDISLVTSSEESSSGGDLESSRDRANDLSVNSFPRSPGAEISAARRLSSLTLWADSPMSVSFCLEEEVIAVMGQKVVVSSSVWGASKRVPIRAIFSGALPPEKSFFDLKS